MATDTSLDLHNLGAYEEGLETATPDNVADEGGEQVTEATAEEVVTTDTDDPTVSDDTGGQPVSQVDFRAMKSTHDKQMAALKAENAALKEAQSTPPTGPNADEVNRYKTLESQYLQARSMAEDGSTEEERSRGSYHAGLLRWQLMQAESVVIARSVGIDPQDPAYLKMLESDGIETSADISRIAWQVRATSTPSHETSQNLEQRAKVVREDEASMADTIKQEVTRQMAAARQSDGQNATVGMQPGGVPGGKTAVVKAYRAAMKRGDVDTVLNMKTQYDYLG